MQHAVLSVHPPSIVKILSSHAAHKFVKFTGQPFFFSQTGKVADMVDEHATVDGHGTSNRGVLGEGAYDG